MRKLGKELISEAYTNVEWCSFDLNKQEIHQKADIILASYILNELAENQLKSALDKMWMSTDQFLILVDNGTPKTFEMMKKIRTYLIQKGAFLLAPCPHMCVCSNEWCHFSVRVGRTKTHRILKDGVVPYEDEKFTYLIFSKKNIDLCSSRVLRHPQIEKGKITLQLCSQNGIERKVITKKDDVLFKIARKIKVGESFN